MIAINGSLAGGLSVVLADGRVEIPAWNVAMDAVGMPVGTADELAGLLEAASAPVVLDDLTIDTIDPTAPNGNPPTPINPMLTEIASFENDAEATNREPTNGEREPAPSSAVPDWSPPQTQVTVHLLGVPAVTGPSGEIRLTAQQMAATAFLAVKREATLDEFRSAIWGDDVEVKDHRVRDLLSELRKALVVKNAVANVENRIVRAPVRRWAATSTLSPRSSTAPAASRRRRLADCAKPSICSTGDRSATSARSPSSGAGPISPSSTRSGSTGSRPPRSSSPSGTCELMSPTPRSRSPSTACKPTR